jgi:hypothetical protein
MEEIKHPDFAIAYSKIQDTVNIGFFVSTGSGPGRITWLADTDDKTGDDTAALLRARISRPYLMRERVVGCRWGVAVVERTGGYYSNNPCLGEKHLTTVAPPAPKFVQSPHFINSNTYGKFVLLQDLVQGGIAFFVEDASAQPARVDLGVSCGPSTITSVHVAAFSSGQWSCYGTPQINFANQIIFKTSPSCIVTKDRLYMDYIVGLVVTFWVTDVSFSHTALPREVTNGCLADTDYAFGEHCQADLLVAHMKFGILNTYALSQTKDEHTWVKMSSICLLDMFVRQFGMPFWQRLFKFSDGEPEHTQASPLQIRSISRNGYHVFITLADDEGFFTYDTVKMMITETYRGPEGKTGPVLTLTEPWPPVF